MKKYKVLQSIGCSLHYNL